MITSLVDRYVDLNGVRVPTFIYGTAWKEARTEGLVQTALGAGFRGIDTANQRRHYNEGGVGAAVTGFMAAQGVGRGELFLQSKFTYAAGQDHRLPYDPRAGYEDQVKQSVESSLEHLHTDYLDAYLLHGPLTPYGLAEADWEVWEAMAALQRAGTVRLIGVSNVNGEQLRLLVEGAGVKPAIVQNRCFARTRWDAEVRKLCDAHGVLYQGFSLLTANARELNCTPVYRIAQRLGCPVARVVFRFCLQLGILPLTGTTDEGHMREDLGAYDIALDPADMALIENVIQLY
jgi:diketogulonate reductase-like aldo/keto reductase